MTFCTVLLLLWRFHYVSVSYSIHTQYGWRLDPKPLFQILDSLSTVWNANFACPYCLERRKNGYEKGHQNRWALHSELMSSSKFWHLFASQNCAYSFARHTTWLLRRNKIVMEIPYQYHFKCWRLTQHSSVTQYVWFFGSSTRGSMVLIMWVHEFRQFVNEAATCWY